MATPQAAFLGGTTDNIQVINSRLVWVLNLDPVFPYKAKWRGKQVEVPANQQKIAKLFTEGGNLYPYLEAVHFVRDLVEAQGYEMDQMGKPQPIFRNKMLKEAELTKEERADILGETPEKTQNKIAAAEKSAQRATKAANSRAKNKIVVEDDEEPLTA